MISAATVERQVAEMLADEALIRAPEGALTEVLGRIEGLPQHRGPFVGIGLEHLPLRGRRRLVIAVVAALLAMGMAIAGAMLLRAPEPPDGVSSLVILVHQPYAENGPALPVTVLAIDADGSQRTIATIQPGQLEGRYAEWYAGLSIDGHLVLPTTTDGGGSIPAVIDLRNPTAPAQLPDAEGAMPKFGPDGRFAMDQNDGSTAIFDPLSGTTTAMRAVGGGMLVERDFGPIWTADGGFLAASGTGSTERTLDLFRIDAAGNRTDGFPRPYYAGVGPRRVDASGRLLRCDVQSEDPCDTVSTLRAVGPTGAPAVWTQSDGSTRVTDFAWATDGGLWIMTETTAGGPRTIEVRHVAPTGPSTLIATLGGPPDDPDPDSYQPAATFAAFAPDDSRIVLQVNDRPVTTLWSIEPRTSRTARLPDGIVAGWLGPKTLTSPRPPVERVPDLPEALRGDWVRDDTELDIGRHSVGLRTGSWIRTAVDARSDRSGELVIDDLSTIPGCASGLARYSWSVEGDRLVLHAIDDPCQQRAELLDGEFSHALGTPDTGGVTTQAGLSYVAPAFAAPFRATMPTGAKTLVDTNRGDWVVLSSGPGGDAAVITLLVPKTGYSDPCHPETSEPVQLQTGGSVRTYLDGLRSVRVTSSGTITIGGRTVPTVRLQRVDPATCPEIDLFTLGGSFRGQYPVPETTRLAVVEHDGVNVVILIGNVAAEGDDPWVRDLLGSLEWLP